MEKRNGQDTGNQTIIYVSQPQYVEYGLKIFVETFMVKIGPKIAGRGRRERRPTILWAPSALDSNDLSDI